MPLRKSLAVMLLVAATSVGFARKARELFEGSDPRAEPFKKAVAALVKRLAAGDLQKAEAEYAGKEKDLELLKAYVNGVKAANGLRTELKSKFGNQIKELRLLDTDVARTGVHDFNTVIILEDANRASSSADSPLGVGIEFQQVKGTWKVLSLVSAPDTADQHLKRLKRYLSEVERLTAKVHTGGFQNPDEAVQAAEATEQLLTDQ